MLSQFVDVEVDVDELSPEQVTEINKMATTYGMVEEDFVWFVRSFFNQNSPLECIWTRSKWTHCNELILFLQTWYLKVVKIQCVFVAGCWGRTRRKWRPLNMQKHWRQRRPCTLYGQNLINPPIYNVCAWSLVFVIIMLFCFHQGRRSRRQRREFREKYMKGRQISPPR